MSQTLTEKTTKDVSVSIACLTDIGRVRKNNQDAFIVTDLTQGESITTSAELLARPIGMHGVLLAVADGMGGAQAGDIASQMAISQLAGKLIAASERKSVSTWLSTAIKAANQEIRSASETPEYQGMGATMTAAVIHEGRAFIGQVGDSRGYLIREGHIQQITKDQSLVQAMLDAGQITEEAAARFPYRNVILKALGATDEIEPDIGAVTLARNDHLLLCSDGLSNKVGNVEMHDTIVEAESLGAACEQLVALANERGGEDNITLVVARFEGNGWLALKDDSDWHIRVEHQIRA